MKLTAEQIQHNWNEFLKNIDLYISSPRKEKLLEFYKRYEDRLVLMPAAHKKEYHNAFPGGYIEHVNRVVEAAIKLHSLWEEFEADMSTFTTEGAYFFGGEEAESFAGTYGETIVPAYLKITKPLYNPYLWCRCSRNGCNLKPRK